MGKMTRLICLWATLGCGVAWAQSDGFIEGTVTGEAGEARPGANIAVRSPADDHKAGTTADADGQFRIAVPAGNYQVEITFVGYKSDLRENVQVRADQTTRLDVVLVEQVIFLAQSVGASQTIDWQYNYAQLRLLYRDWFLQAFRNWNDAGDTYLLRTGIPVVDRSSLNVFQAQHTSSLGQRQRFTYGLDALLTRPDTDGTTARSRPSRLPIPTR